MSQHNFHIKCYDALNRPDSALLFMLNNAFSTYNMDNDLKTAATDNDRHPDLKRIEWLYDSDEAFIQQLSQRLSRQYSHEELREAFEKLKKDVSEIEPNPMAERFSVDFFDIGFCFTLNQEHKAQQNAQTNYWTIFKETQIYKALVRLVGE